MKGGTSASMGKRVALSRLHHQPLWRILGKRKEKRILMGRWNNSYEEPFFGYSGDHLDRYPWYVVQAFFAVSYDGSLPTLESKSEASWPRDEEDIVAEALESFAHRRGVL